MPVSRIGSLVAVLLLSLSALAALTAPALAERVALVIGNADYESSRDLRNPVNDAEDMAARLAEIGFRVHGGGAHVNLTREAMVDVARDFTNSLQEGDIALYYYAGHGAEYEGENYLIPTDDGSIAFADDLPDYAYSASSILQRLAGRPGVTSILILDACRNNPLPERSGTRTVQQGLAQMEAPVGTSAFIIYAAGKGQTAADGEGRNSLFTEAFLSALRNPARGIDDIVYEVSYAVRIATEGAQVPWAEIAIAGRQVPFLIDPAEAPPAPEPAGPTVEDLAWQGIGGLDDPAVRFAALVAFVERFPDGEHTAAARVMIAEFEAAAAGGIDARHEGVVVSGPVLGPGGEEAVAVDGQDRPWFGAEEGAADAAASAATGAEEVVELNSGWAWTVSETVTIGPVNVDGEPFYGRLNLAAGFLPDPQRFALQAGGFEDASQLADGCNGFIARDPDYLLNYTAGAYQLFLSATSYEDTVLVVRDPNGDWHCNDDHQYLNPAVGFPNPGSGEYRIWVGTYQNTGSFPTSQLLISEIGPQF